MPHKRHILIVDDDSEIRELLAHFLRKHDFDVSLAADGVEMEQQLQHHQFDLITLDLMLPGEDGLILCQRLRRDTKSAIIMLTAMGEETDRIVGLEMGADDYISKPFNPRELLARIKAVLRRSGQSENTKTQCLHFSGWTLDLGRRELSSDEGVLTPVSDGEFKLLQVLAEHPQEVLSREFLLDHIKGRKLDPFDRSIDVQLSRLRRKIEQNPKEPQIIKTIRSGGYRFSQPVTRS